MTRRVMSRPDDAGVILVNVLVALALGSALVVLMLTSQENLLDRARRAAAASQAQAMALGAETSVIVALRRDMTDSPAWDAYDEPWAAVQQDEVTLQTGRFSVRVSDAHARFDVNSLADGGLVQVQALVRLLAALDLPAELAARIAGEIARRGPVAGLSDLSSLDPISRAALAPVADALPDGGDVNLNTAGTPLIAALTNSPVAATRLDAQRKRAGHLTLDDIGGGVPGAGVTSDLFDARVVAQVDDVTVTLTSRLQRLRGAAGNRVVVVRRRFGTAGDDLPPLPQGLAGMN